MKYFYILIILIAFDSQATKWIESTVDDPIKKGASCNIDQVASFGSYVYDWQSKYDQIFFPYTSSSAIWFCDKSGYISFMGDFENLSSTEKTVISNYLQQNPQKNIRSLLSKLELLEKIYSLRTLPKDISNRNKRILAYLYEQKGKFKKANELRKLALEEIYELLKDNLSERKKLEYLYVAANYERQLGNVADSDLRLKFFNQHLENIKDENLAVFGSYLLNLTRDTLLIKPGGKLAPEVEVKEKEINVTEKTPNKIDDWIANVSDDCRTIVKTVYEDLSPIFSSHIKRTLLKKEVEDLLLARKIILKNGSLSNEFFNEYDIYKGEQVLRNEVRKLTIHYQQSCENVVAAFTEFMTLEFISHMERVIKDAELRLEYKKADLTDENIMKSLTALDRLLVKNINDHLYCYVLDYDVYDHQLCPEKTLPYKDIFIRVKTEIQTLTLNISDSNEVQKLYRGLASIDI